MARRFRPGLDPLGTRLAIDADTRSDGWFTIVGVVRDVRQTGLDIPPRPEMYIPYPQIDRRPWLAPRDLVVRTAGDPMRLARAVTRVVHDVDPTIAVSNVRTLDDVLDEDVASRRMGTTLLAAFAAFALLLAVVGIYGVTASFVAQHVPDLGVRIALGASAGDIIGLVVWKGLKLALTGIAIGAIAAVIVTRLMSGLLFGVSAVDPATFAAGAVLVLGLAFLASYLPARCASGIDPIRALRAD